MSASTQEPIIVDRSRDLVLRAAGPHYEIISNGVFLMDTRNGESERLLVRAALDRLQRHDRPAPSILIGGLGVGFTLAEAVSTPTGPITVVELEPAIIAWHRTHLRRYTAHALADPRVHLIQADLLTHLAAGHTRYDVICLDIDNGPDWIVTDANGALYGPHGLALIRRRLAPGSILTVWSANASPAFETLLRRHLTGVETIPVPVPRGEPDLIYLGHNL